MSDNPPPPPPYSAPPPQDPYGQGGYAQQPEKKGSGLAIAALVLGILALLLCWTVFGGIIFGLIAIVLGLIASSRAKKGLAGGRGMAIIGLILGVLGLLIAIGFIVVAAVFLNSDSAQNLQDCLSNAGSDQTAQQQCQDDFRDKLTN